MFFFSCIWKYVRITNEDDELTVNIFNENVTDSTTVKTTTISIYEIYDFYVTESHLHFDEKISEKSVTASNQNATVNELSDENVVEKINASPKPQDENDNETQGADPFKLIVIVSSIILFAVVTIIIGLFIFCLRGEKKEDVMEMKKIETGEISDTFMD